MKFKFDDINELEQMCKRNDTQLTIYEDRSILFQYICPVVIPSRCGKYQVFINSLLPAMQLNPDVLKFDDDSEIPDELIDELNGIAERITTNIDWKKGDILMIDKLNFLKIFFTFMTSL